MNELKVRVIVAVCAAVLAVSVMLCSEGSGVADPVLTPAGNDSCAEDPREYAEANLKDMLLREEQFTVLLGWTNEVQSFAGKIMDVFGKHGGSPKAEFVRPVAQECVRQFRLHSDNWWTSHQDHLVLCFGFETGWTLDPRSTGAAGERGIFQFIPSTARSGGYDFSRFGSTKPEDIRYQVRAGFDWMSRGNTEKWARSQWCGSYPHAMRELGR